MAQNLSNPVVGSGSHSLNRATVARMIGQSVSAVRRLEQKGALHPKKSRNGRWLFDAAEVRNLPPRRAWPKKVQRVSSGQAAALAFRCFAQGYDLIQCVDILKIDPEEVQRLYAHYERNDLRAQLDAEHEAKLNKSYRK